MDPIGDRAAIATMRQHMRGGRHGHRDLAIFSLGLNTAFRVCDLLALDVGDVRLPDGRIRASLEIREGKTAKARRTPLNGAARQALAEYLRLRPGRAAVPLRPGRAALHPGRPQAPLLGRPRRRARAERRPQPAEDRRADGVPRLRKDLAMIQKLLNHASPGVTLRYIGITRKAMYGVVQRLNL
ncbi:MAG: tyrosine-type recombinase/integrase [Deltaproteobacteria bacterium]|nr:tyrosine-type recombinase/integrase [Deltaproteobacteria bacterium]